MLAAHHRPNNPTGKRLGLPHSHFEKTQLTDSTIYNVQPLKNRRFSSPVAKDGLRLSTDLPLVIEIVDTEEKINSFLPVLDEMMKGGLVTLEKARVIDYRADAETEIPPKT